MSKLFRLNKKDLIKSIQLIIISSVIPSIGVILDSGRLPSLSEFRNILLVGFVAWTAYIVKNFLTNSKDEFLTNESDSSH